jgi:hypothetical protein
MSTAHELRDFAESCHMLGLATNNPKWHSLAERILQHASSGNEHTATPLNEPSEEVTPTDDHARKDAYRKAA